MHAKRLLTIKAETDLEKAKKCLTLDDINAGYIFCIILLTDMQNRTPAQISRHIFIVNASLA